MAILDNSGMGESSAAEWGAGTRFVSLRAAFSQGEDFRSFSEEEAVQQERKNGVRTPTAGRTKCELSALRSPGRHDTDVH